MDWFREVIRGSSHEAFLLGEYPEERIAKLLEQCPAKLHILSFNIMMGYQKSRSSAGAGSEACYQHMVDAFMMLSIAKWITIVHRHQAYIRSTLLSWRSYTKRNRFAKKIPYIKRWARFIYEDCLNWQGSKTLRRKGVLVPPADILTSQRLIRGEDRNLLDPNDPYLDLELAFGKFDTKLQKASMTAMSLYRGTEFAPCSVMSKINQPCSVNHTAKALYTCNARNINVWPTVFLKQKVYSGLQTTGDPTVPSRTGWKPLWAMCREYLRSHPEVREVANDMNGFQEYLLWETFLHVQLLRSRGPDAEKEVVAIRRYYNAMPGFKRSYHGTDQERVFSLYDLIGKYLELFD
jgi:hypothetical protein